MCFSSKRSGWFQRKGIEWRPIETAPRDGTRIWLGTSHSIRIGFWQQGEMHENHGSIGGGWRDMCAAEQIDGMTDLHFLPTHSQAAKIKRNVPY